ncbi:uncharacterized protein TNCV_2368761 [Trichonephila clavipes]|nr:uncharacterized protein TNCV_2368761 [Trichonephila clavipes]
MDPNRLCPGKGLVLHNPYVDNIAAHTRFLLISLPDNCMLTKSPFAINKALIGISSEPKSVKRLRSGDLLVETRSTLQTKYFLLDKPFLDSPVTISLHKTLNSCRSVISESDLLTTPEAEILDGFSDQGMIQVRKITIKKEASAVPTKHLILTFNTPKLPATIKAGYLNASDDVEADANRSDMDYITDLASMEYDSLLEANFEQRAPNPLTGTLSPSSPQK